MEPLASDPIPRLCEYIWGVSHPAGRSSSLTCSRLDKIWRIHADVPPYADNTHGASSTARLEPVVLPRSSGWFREHGWVTPNPVFEPRGYAKRRSAARSAAKRTRRLVTRCVLPTNKGE